MELAMNLLLNTSLLVSICIIFNLFYQKILHQKAPYKIIGGVILGFAGIAIMSIAFKLPNGAIFDTRSILLSISGLFYGFLPTTIAAVLIILYRITLGGPGVYAGIAVTITSAAIGILLRQVSKDPQNLSKSKFYLFGLVNHIVMLLCMFLLPRTIFLDTLKSISIPVLTIYPLGTLALSLIITYEWKSLVTEKKLTESEFQFKAVYEEAPIGIVVATPQRILYANEEAARIFKMSVGEVTEISWAAFTHPEDLAKESVLFAQIVSGEINQYDIVKRFILRSDEVVWVHLYCRVFHRDLVSNVTKFVVIIQDISNDIENEHNLKEASLFLTTLLDSIPDHIFYKNKEGFYLGCNAAFENSCGLSRTEIIGKNDFDLYDSTLSKKFIQSDLEAIKGSKAVRTEETVMYPDGRTIITETLKTKYKNTDGIIAGIIGISRDITERKREQERIEFLNIHDVMTGLYNRMYFDKELDRIDEQQELPYSIISVDIDSLKLTNDMFGHQTGDQLIIRTADILRDCCGDGIVARTGGDEFCILLPGTDENEIKNYVNNIRIQLDEQKNENDAVSTMLSISWGYSTKNRNDQTISEIINTAEENMYRRKLLKHQTMRSSLLTTIKELLFSKGSETKEHADRMAKLANMLGKELELNETDLDSLELMATLHDVGKIGISSHILSKPGKLDEAEWMEIKKHPEIGYRIAITVPELQGVAEYILCHHERWDGNGYPQGLSGTDIPYISRLISVIDAFDAMTEDRAYRKAMTRDEALKEILTNAGTQFDPSIARAFVKNILRHNP